MSDRQDEPRDADELTRQVAELGDTDEDRLDAVTEHNESLRERLPDDDLPGAAAGAAEDADGSPGIG